MREETREIRRHGEVLLKPISKPKGLKDVAPVTHFIVGHSESGHHHVLTAQAIQVYEQDGRMFLHIQDEAQLIHQKTGTETHGTQLVEPGWYERIVKRSYSYAAKVMRRVQD